MVKISILLPIGIAVLFIVQVISDKGREYASHVIPTLIPFLYELDETLDEIFISYKAIPFGGISGQETMHLANQYMDNLGFEFANLLVLMMTDDDVSTLLLTVSLAMHWYLPLLADDNCFIRITDLAILSEFVSIAKMSIVIPLMKRVVFLVKIGGDTTVPLIVHKIVDKG